MFFSENDRFDWRRKLAVKVVDIFGDGTMTTVEVNMGGRS